MLSGDLYLESDVLAGYLAHLALYARLGVPLCGPGPESLGDAGYGGAPICRGAHL